MKALVMAMFLIFISGCAQKALVKEWKEGRGYTDGEIEIMKPYIDQYTKTMAASASFGSPFATASNTAASEQRLRNIVCNCLKKLGEGCRKRPVKLEGADLDLWAKSNAAEYAMRGSHSDSNLTGVSASAVDSAECP